MFTHNYPRTVKDRRDAGTLIYDFAKILSKKNKVTVLCPDFGGIKENYKDVKVKWFKYGSQKKFGNYSFFNLKDLFNLVKLFIAGCIAAEKLVKSKKIDYILCSWAIPSGVFALYAKLKLGTRYGIWYLGSDLNIYGKMPVMKNVMQIIAKKANNLFANSMWLCSLAKKSYKKECIFTPTSTTLSIKGVKHIKLGSKVANILFVARLEKVKGPDILLEAIKIVAKSYNSFVLRIIGNGTMEDDLKKFAINNNLSKNVEFLGNPGWYVNASYMQSSDFLMVASRNESLPLVMIEAANFNLPIISSDVGDSRRVVNKYNVGVISRSEDPRDMANKILDFIKNRKYVIYKKSGRFEQFVDDYSLDNSAKLFLKTINT